MGSGVSLAYYSRKPTGVLMIAVFHYRGDPAIVHSDLFLLLLGHLVPCPHSDKSNCLPCVQHIAKHHLYKISGGCRG